MPVTPAHVVVAIPAWRRRRWWAAALAAGSIAPDLPHFVPIDPSSEGAKHARELTHTLVGAATIDVAAGLLLLVIGVTVLWPAVLEFAPDAFVGRVSPPPRRPRGRPLVVGSVLAVLVGCLVHVMLDAFTHLRMGRWPTPVFGHSTGGQIAQGVLSFLGLMWLAWEAVRFADRPREHVVHVHAPVERGMVLLAMGAIAVVAGYGRATEIVSGKSGVWLYGTLAFHAALRAISVLSILVVVGAGLWVGARSWSARRAERYVRPRSGRAGDSR